jgi:pilus assembly protein CpaB
VKNKALVAAALAAALGIGLLWLYKQRFETRVSGGPRVGVLIATRDIPMGTRLTPALLGIRSLPQAYLEERHLRASEAQRIIGVRVRTRLRANESILWSDLSTTSGDARNLAELVPPGMRAIAIPAKVSSSFEGLLQPGDRVDALMTSKKAENTQDKVTVPLLQNLLVLALGEDLGEDKTERNAEGRRARRATVTLGVTVEQSEVLAFAAEQGDLTLTLRHPDDITIVDDLPETSLANVMRPEQRAALQRGTRAQGPEKIERARE